MYKQTNGHPVQGTEVPRETDVTNISEEKVKEWVRNDLSSAILLLQSVLGQEALIQSIADYLISSARQNKLRLDLELEAKGKG